MNGNIFGDFYGTWGACGKVVTSSQATHLPPESILELFFDGAKQKSHGCGYVALCLFVPITPLYELFEPVFCGWIAWKR